MRWGFYICLLPAVWWFGQVATAQEWQVAGLDTFAVGADQTVYLAAGNTYGVAYQMRPQPAFPHRFWIQADIWYEHDPKNSELWFVFGAAVGDTIRLWAAGYSHREREIRFLRLHRHSDGHYTSETLARKTVEIIDFRRKYVYRILFLHDTNQLRTEVNGVPMLAALPVSTRKLTYFGYMQKGLPVRVGRLQFDGE